MNALRHSRAILSRMAEAVGGQQPFRMGLSRRFKQGVRGKNLFLRGFDGACGKVCVEIDTVAVGLRKRIKASPVDQLDQILLRC